MAERTDADREAARRRRNAYRARVVRWEYYPSATAWEVIEAKRAMLVGHSFSAADRTNSAVIDAIVIEWAKANGVTLTKRKPKLKRRIAEKLRNN